MSTYTDARSIPGKKGAGGSDERELFMVKFGDMVLEAWTQTFDYEGHTHVKTINKGKADVFPIIGRKRNAAEHVPGEIILGGKVEHNEVQIDVDAYIFDSAFIADIDEIMADYDLARPYAKQLGESLASMSCGRIARSIINAARVTDPPYTGGPVPGKYEHADLKTDASKLEEAAFAAGVHIRTNDIGGGDPIFRMPWLQYSLLSRYTGIDTVDTSGSGNRSTGQVGLVGGIRVKGTNHIPQTEVTSGTENRAKYQGDFTTTVGEVSNPQAVGTLRVRGVTAKMIPQPDRIGTMLLAHKLEGHGKLRPECAFEVKLPDPEPEE